MDLRRCEDVACGNNQLLISSFDLSSSLASQCTYVVGQSMTIDDLIESIRGSTLHNVLYHFTDESNFPEIDKKGLLSKNLMRAQGWWPKATGGNALSHKLDDQMGISNSVSLCFTRNHPMKYIAQTDSRLPAPRYLGINPEVLKIPGTKVAFGIANASGTKIVDLGNAIGEMDIEVLYSKTDWSDLAVNARLRAAEKMELLVPNEVPRSLIVSVF
jgi:hypothetical protein